MTPLLELYKQYTGCTADSLQCIAGSGSNRVYYRLSVTEPVDVLMTEGNSVPEGNSGNNVPDKVLIL